VHVGATLVADEQAFEVMEMGEGALEDPTDATKSGAVRGLAAGDERRDPAPAQLLPVPVGVIAAVADDGCRPAPGATDAACHCRYGLDQREQLLDVVVVGAGQAPGERDAGRVYEEMLL
jgi:hypothetical protein